MSNSFTENKVMPTEPKATQNSGKNKGIANIKPFKAGQSGNPGGRPKKKPLTELYERILADPKNIAAIEKAVLKALSRGNMAMVLLLREITERVEGKVMQPIEADITVNLADAIAEARKRVAQRAGTPTSQALRGRFPGNRLRPSE